MKFMKNHGLILMNKVKTTILKYPMKPKVEIITKQRQNSSFQFLHCPKLLNISL